MNYETEKLNTELWHECIEGFKELINELNHEYSLDYFNFELPENNELHIMISRVMSYEMVIVDQLQCLKVLSECMMKYFCEKLKHIEPID